MKIGRIVQRFSITVGILLFLFLVLGLGAAFRNEQKDLHESAEVKIGPETFVIGAGYTNNGHDRARGQRIDNLLFEVVMPDLRPVAFASRAQSNDRWFYRDHTILVLLSYKGPSYAEGDIPRLYTARGASSSDSESIPDYRRPLIVVTNSDLYIRKDPTTEPAFVMCQRKSPGNPAGRNRCSTIDAIDPIHYPQGEDGRYQLTMEYYVPRDELKNIVDIDQKLRGLVLGWELAGKN